MDAFLNLTDVRYSYHSPEGETPALSDISFSVKEGEFVAIVGPSGCGKSTLLNLICGLLAPEAGEITLKGNPVLRERERIGYMLQKDHLFEWRSIYRNVILGLEIRRKCTEETLARQKPCWNSMDWPPSAMPVPANCPAACASGGPHPHPGAGTGASTAGRTVLRPGLPDKAYRL